MNLLIKGKSEEKEKTINGPFLENFKLLNFRKDETKTDFFSELFELLEKDNDMPLFFLSKDREIFNKPENFPSTINSERFSFLGDFMSLKTPHDYSHKFLNKLCEDLKKNYPNLFSSSPSGRKDVLNLKDWLSNTLKSIFQSNELVKKDKYIIADEAFNLCINELIRQISFDCLERGELMTMIWRNYLKLFHKIFDYELQEKNIFQNEKETEFLKYSKMYREQLAEKDRAISQQIAYNEDVIKEISSLKAEISQWKKNEQKNVEQTEKMKKISEQLFMKGRKLKIENEEIRYKLSKYRDESQKSRVFKKNATMTRMFESQTAFVPLNEEDSDKEFNTELEDQQLKDIMKLLGEDESENEDINKKNKDLDNPIIIKCFQEQKEKILLVKSTEIDHQIRDSFFSNKGIQTELNLTDKKFDPIFIKENLDEIINERVIKKNLLHFKVDSRRESIKKFTDVVTDIQRRNSVVVDLLNCISPLKQPKLSTLNQTSNSKKPVSRIEIQNNSSQDNSWDSSQVENKEIDDKIKMNSLEKNEETIEINIELPSKAKTILEKRNSLILEISKKIVKDYDGKSSMFKKNEIEKGNHNYNNNNNKNNNENNNSTFNFNFESNEMETNNYYIPPPKNIKTDKTELSKINASVSIEENISEKKKK